MSCSAVPSRTRLLLATCGKEVTPLDILKWLRILAAILAAVLIITEDE